MAMYLTGYALIILVVAFLVFSILVKRKILFGNTIAVQRVFANPLLHYSIKRILSALISVTLAIIVTFLLIRWAKPASKYCAEHFNDPKLPAIVRELQCDTWKKNMGYDGTLLEQLFKFFYSILPFPKTICLTSYEANAAGQYVFKVTDCHNAIIDFGRIYDTPQLGIDGYLVTDYMIEHAGVSFKVGIFAVLLELGLGYPFGILMAKYQNGIFDKIGKGYIIIIDAIPGIAYYYILYGVLIGIFHLDRMSGGSSNFGNEFAAVLTMGIAGMSGIGLWVRRYMVDEFNADYVKFARSKGLSENRIMGIHVLRNAVVPLARTFPSAVIGALMGSYFTEQMYHIPGIGSALLVASNNGNAPVLQGLVIISAYLSIISYLLGDIVTAIVDPRIRFSD